MQLKSEGAQCPRVLIALGMSVFPHATLGGMIYLFCSRLELVYVELHVATLLVMLAGPKLCSIAL